MKLGGSKIGPHKSDIIARIDKDNDASPEAEIEIERVNLERVDNIDMNGNNHLDEIIKEEIKV